MWALACAWALCNLLYYITFGVVALLISSVVFPFLIVLYYEL